MKDTLAIQHRPAYTRCSLAIRAWKPWEQRSFQLLQSMPPSRSPLLMESTHPVAICQSNSTKPALTVSSISMISKTISAHVNNNPGCWFSTSTAASAPPPPSPSSPPSGLMHCTGCVWSSSPRAAAEWADAHWESTRHWILWNVECCSNPNPVSPVPSYWSQVTDAASSAIGMNTELAAMTGCNDWLRWMRDPVALGPGRWLPFDSHSPVKTPKSRSIPILVLFSSHHRVLSLLNLSQWGMHVQGTYLL